MSAFLCITENKTSFILQIKYEPLFEPYVVVKTSSAPKYDERSVQGYYSRTAYTATLSHKQ